MDLELVDYKDSVLHSPTEKFDFSNPQLDIVDFSESLVKKMRDEGALGLAAPQVGVPLAIFAIETDLSIIINPKIVELSKELQEISEGCLSYKDLYVKVKSPNWVLTRFNHPDGSARTYKFEGMAASVFQHELDHLKGLTFWDTMDKFHEERYQRRWKKILRSRK